MSAEIPTQDDDPYEGARRPLSLRLNPPAPPTADQLGGGTVAAFGKFGAELWGVARQVLAFWTPARLETEALRRADDAAGPSLVAEEAAKLTDVYQAWLVGEHALEANWLDPGRPSLAVASAVRQNSFLRERIAETLAAIERRASAAEARALDLRLRLDHERLRAELRKQELSSALFDAIKAAAKDPESEEHLKTIASKLDRLAVVEKRLGSIEGEVVYVADHVMADFASREMKPPAVKTLTRIGELATSGTVKTAIGYIIKKLIGG